MRKTAIPLAQRPTTARTGRGDELEFTFCIEWNSKTYIAFGHHALRIPLPMYSTIGVMLVVMTAVFFAIYFVRTKGHETT